MPYVKNKKVQFSKNNNKVDLKILKSRGLRALCQEEGWIHAACPGTRGTHSQLMSRPFNFSNILFSLIFCSVTDPGCLSWILDPVQKDSGSRIRIRISLGNMIRDDHPGSGSLFFTHPGSRGQKGHWISDPDPQH